jgi:hypothetical protein
VEVWKTGNEWSDEAGCKGILKLALGVKGCCLRGVWIGTDGEEESKREAGKEAEEV